MDPRGVDTAEAPPSKDKTSLPNSEVDVAAQLIVQSRDLFQRAMGLLSDSREKSIAITHHDTALLWLNQAMTTAKMAEERRAAELRILREYK